jgi:hypothetical protein
MHRYFGVSSCVHLRFKIICGRGLAGTGPDPIVYWPRTAALLKSYAVLYLRNFRGGVAAELD